MGEGGGAGPSDDDTCANEDGRAEAKPSARVDRRIRQRGKPPRRMMRPLLDPETRWFERELVAVPFVAVTL
jgi:hypothetical protein